MGTATECMSQTARLCAKLGRFYQRAMENDKTDSLFSGEEDYGKRRAAQGSWHLCSEDSLHKGVDMHELFVTYLNLKKISTLRTESWAGRFSRWKAVAKDWTDLKEANGNWQAAWVPKAERVKEHRETVETSWLLPPH